MWGRAGGAREGNKKNTHWNVCASFPLYFIAFFTGELITAKNKNLEKQTVKVGGYSAKCFLHEWDHLQGVTFKDRVSKLKWNMALKKARKKRKNV